MRVQFNLIAIGLFLSLAVPPAAAQIQADPFPPQLETDLSAGTSAIYLLDFEKARAHFNHAIELDPEHPAAYFFTLMSYWYELTYDSLMNRNPEMEKTLENQAELASRKAEEYSRNPERKAVAYLYWGGAQGAKGWYHVTRNNWVRAYLAGKKGYNRMKEVLEISPDLYDAYLGVGMFEYYAATLGPTLKALASFAVRGNKEEAVHFLTVAETQSRYVRMEAAYFLWNAASDEGRLDEALGRALRLKAMFPHSPFFRWCEIYTLTQQGKWKEALDACEQFIALANAGPQPENHSNPFRKMLAKVYYHSGTAAFHMGNVSLAKTYFDKTIDQESEFLGWRVMAYLRRGEIFDLEHKRTDAVAKYKAVLLYPDIWDSHKSAKKRIKKPYERE